MVHELSQRDGKLDLPATADTRQLEPSPAPGLLARLQAGLLRLQPRLRRYRRLIADSLCFDADFYRQGAPLPGWGQAEPILHYLLIGGLEGRDPNPLFFTQDYLACRPDAAAARAPFLHYLVEGRPRGASGLRDHEPDRHGPYHELLQAGIRPSPLYRSKALRELRIRVQRRRAADGSRLHPDLLPEPRPRDALDRAHVAHLLANGSAALGEHHLEAIVAPWFGSTAGLLPAADEPPAEMPFTARLRERLNARLAAGRSLTLPTSAQPRLSVLVVVFNQAALTLGALEALAAQRQPPPFEVIVVDNGSTDETQPLLSLCTGVRILRQGENLHFLRGVNAALPEVRGEHLLLLNNDAFLAPDALAVASSLLDADPGVGALGGKLILADGRLQEAGSYHLPDGRTNGYGRCQHPLAPPYQFQRDVDFVSGALLVIRSALFRDLGGFDPAFVPAYYEDTDLCERLWNTGQVVRYDPRVVALHLESASSSGLAARALMDRNRLKFRERYAARLASLPQGSPPTPWQLRRRQGRYCRDVLFIDDDIPRASWGSGFPRTAAILSSLVASGNAVTFLAINAPPTDWQEIRRQVPIEVEVLTGTEYGLAQEYVLHAMHHLDAVLISRPHNMERLRGMVKLARAQGATARVIYDAEALFASRETLQARIEGAPLPPAEASRRLRREVALAATADVVTAVSEREVRQFRRSSGKPTLRLGHALDGSVGPKSFAERRGLLFVGPVLGEGSPNEDALRWFARQIWPGLRARLGPDVPFVTAGRQRGDLRSELLEAGIHCPGFQPDLTPLYGDARVFVAPTRFAAGLPLKVLEAAAQGVPVVATRLLGQQLGWRDGKEILLAPSDDPAAFAQACRRLYEDQRLWQRLRAGALARIRRDYSPAGFRVALEQALAGSVAPPTTSRPAPDG